MNLVQILPRRTGNADGVAHYAERLAESLKHDHSITSQFLIGTPTGVTTSVDDPWETVTVPERSPGALRYTISQVCGFGPDQVVLLHYVNYGYQTRGVPLWLIRGLAKWRREYPSGRLITVFHELYARGYPHQSSFWLSPLQQHLARRLWELSDAAVTSLQRYRRQLLKWKSADAAHLWTLPVFSSVGEPTVMNSPGTRPARMAVFGRAGIEARAYQKRRALLHNSAEKFEIKEIIDIGPRKAAVPGELEGIPIRAKGQLAHGAVSGELSQCRFGFVDYPLDFIAKSAVFAAYAAHGVIPVVSSADLGCHDGLVPGVHFLMTDDLQDGVPEETLCEVQKSLGEWYDSHALRVHSRALSDHLRAGHFA